MFSKLVGGVPGIKPQPLFQAKGLWVSQPVASMTLLMPLVILCSLGPGHLGE